MTNKQNNLFRQEALEVLSSPEQLDQMMRVVNPRAWLPLTTIGFLVLVACVWSVVGRIPLTVNGSAVLLKPRRVVQFQAPSAGALLKLNIKPGDPVKKGQELATIDQSAIKQQLEQEKAKLAEIEAQNEDKDQLQKQQIEQELTALRQQQTDLEENLRRESIGPVLRQQTLAALEQKRQSLEESLSRESTAPVLRQQTLAALDEKRNSLQQRKQQITSFLETLKERLETRRSFFEQKIVSQDMFLQAQQEYLDAQSQVLDIEAQLKELEVQKTNTERDYQQNLNKINEIRNSIQEVQVQKINTEKDHLETENKIDDINRRIKELDAQRTKLEKENLEKVLTQNNQIQEIKRKIAQLELQLSKESKIISQYEGKVLEVSAAAGQIVSAGMRIGAIEAEDSNSKIVSLIYFADKDGKQIKPGMTVQVTPSIVKRERYGGILGKVTGISPFPVTNQEMSAIIGNENLANTLAKSIGSEGSLVQVFAELQEEPTTISGYKWSSSNGPALKISTGTTAQVQVHIGEQAPISYVMPIFRSLTGIY